MQEVAEEQISLWEFPDDEDLLTIPCVAVISNGEEVKLWLGTLKQSKELEEMASVGDIYVLKLAVGSSEVEYWQRKFSLIKAHWQLDHNLRSWIQSHLLSLKRIGA